MMNENLLSPNGAIDRSTSDIRWVNIDNIPGANFTCEPASPRFPLPPHPPPPDNPSRQLTQARSRLMHRHGRQRTIISTPSLAAILYSSPTPEPTTSPLERKPRPDATHSFHPQQ
jgi:hypothetical protein